MGLDQNINVYRRLDHDHLKEYYMRKVNVVQGYFEDKYLVENNVEREITWTDILTLNELGKRVLENRDPELAAELLPTRVGFFYGAYDYDDWYWYKIEEMVSVMEAILATYNGVDYTFTYYCSY